MLNAIRNTLAVLTAFIASYFLPSQQGIWMILAALLVSQMTRGTPLRQAILYFLIIVCALITAAVINLLEYPYLSAVLFVSVVMLSAYLVFMYRPFSSKIYRYCVLFIVALVIAGFLQRPIAEIPAQSLGVLYGLIIGLLFKQFFFPVSLQTNFCQGVIPVLHALKNNNLAEIEKALVSPQSIYPGWVYDAGFNPGLRASWRFVLVNIERVVELYFAQAYLLSQLDKHSVWLASHAGVVEKNNELIEILIHYFSHKKIQHTESDYTSDIESLESALQTMLPRNVEAIDLAPHYLVLTALVRNCRDMRSVLLQLVGSLPQS